MREYERQRVGRPARQVLHLPCDLAGWDFQLARAVLPRSHGHVVVLHDRVTHVACTTLADDTMSLVFPALVAVPSIFACPLPRVGQYSLRPTQVLNPRHIRGRAGGQDTRGKRWPRAHILHGWMECVRLYHYTRAANPDVRHASQHGSHAD